MRETIKEILRKVPIGSRIERRRIAEEVGTTQHAKGGLFCREFEHARNELWSEGVLFTSSLGGIYERVEEEDKGRVAIDQSRRKMTRALNAARRARAVLQAAPKTDLDENARATLERQDLRTAHAEAMLSFLRRRRVF